MSEARDGHTAAALRDGRVLVVGGVGADGESLASAEVFDPVAGAWSATEAMDQPRSMHTATPLPDGRVLIVGGTRDGVHADVVCGAIRS